MNIYKLSIKKQGWSRFNDDERAQDNQQLLGQQPSILASACY